MKPVKLVLVFMGAAAGPGPACGAAEQPDLPSAQAQVFRAALRAVSPCIVRIDTIGGAAPIESGGEPGAESPVAPVFRQADGPTTGLTCAADGYVLTSSFNFIRDPAVITVTLADGRRFIARLVARDRPGGLALLKVDADDLPVPRWCPRAALRPGRWALVAGYGFGGETPAISVGVLSARDRLEGRAVQTDAKISPANYGGPLFDLEGRVLGVCVPKAGTGEDELAGVEWYDSGIGFAVHGDYIAQRLPRLKEGRDLERGVLGVRFDGLEPVIGEPAGALAAEGVRIAGVLPGPASDAGLLAGDVLLRLNDRPLRRLVEVRRELARLAAGDAVELSYRRGDGVHVARLKLVRAGELQARAAAQTGSQPATIPAETPEAGTVP